MIGWVAGTNGFIEPFQSIAPAIAVFVRIGQYDKTVYVLIRGATLSKSFSVADPIPGKSWTKTTPIKK